MMDRTNFCGLYSTNWANGIAIPCNFDTQTLRSQLVAQQSYAALGPAMASLGMGQPLWQLCQVL